MFVPCGGLDRDNTLCEVLRGGLDEKTIIFTNDVDTCKRVSKRLAARGLGDRVAALHGGLSNNARDRVWEDFLRVGRVQETNE